MSQGAKSGKVSLACMVYFFHGCRHISRPEKNSSIKKHLEILIPDLDWNFLSQRLRTSIVRAIENARQNAEAESGNPSRERGTNVRDNGSSNSR